MKDTSISTGVYEQIINRLFQLKLDKVDTERFAFRKIELLIGFVIASLLEKIFSFFRQNLNIYLYICIRNIKSSLICTNRARQPRWSRYDVED